MVELKMINKTYNPNKDFAVHALKDVSMKIDKGDMVAITGPSGSGKSTLVHILAAISRPDTGEYFFDGKNVCEMSDNQRCKIRNEKIGLIMQDFGLLGKDTVLNNVCLPQMIGGTYGKQIAKKATNMLELVGMGGMGKKKVNQLSGGQKQRVAIARALTMDAELIVADEPTGALDMENTEKLMTLLKELNGQGLTLVIVTHNPYVAEQCARRYMLSDGRLV